MSPRGAISVLAAPLAILGLAVGAPAGAQAAGCPETTLVQPFAKTEEAEKITPSYYSLVAGGDFEAGEAAWTLSGGAKVASGGAVSPLTGKAGKNSLQLPKGGVAVSPLTCVEPSDRVFRFLDRYEGGEATLAVSVAYESVLGPIRVPLTAVSTTSGWAPSPIRHTGAAVASAISGGVAQLSIRLESTKGMARIDDVYLDPRMR